MKAEERIMRSYEIHQHKISWQFYVVELDDLKESRRFAGPFNPDDIIQFSEEYEFVDMTSAELFAVDFIAEFRDDLVGEVFADCLTE
jgi:hypothetical protein